MRYLINVKFASHFAGAFLKTTLIYLYSGIRFIGSPVKRVSRFIGPFYLGQNHVSVHNYTV